MRWYNIILVLLVVASGFVLFMDDMGYVKFYAGIMMTFTSIVMRLISGTDKTCLKIGSWLARAIVLMRTSKETTPDKNIENARKTIETALKSLVPNEQARSALMWQAHSVDGEVPQPPANRA